MNIIRLIMSKQYPSGETCTFHPIVWTQATNSSMESGTTANLGSLIIETCVQSL